MDTAPNPGNHRTQALKLCALGLLVNLPLVFGFLLTGWYWLMSEPLSLPGAASMAAVVVAALLGNALVLCRLYRSRRESESARAAAVVQREQLECILESLPDAVLSVDEAGVIQSCNSAGLKLFGYRSGSLIGKRLGQIIPEEAARRAREVKTDEQRVLGAGRTIEARRRDGSHFPATLTIAKARPEGGPLYTVVVRDLTEINQTRHAAAAADRSKHSFLGRISHELRTPLAGVLGMVDLLRHTPLSNEQGERLDTIQNSAEGLLAIFDRMIDHARLEAGQLRLCREPFSLRQVLERTLSPLRDQAGRKGLGFTVKLSSSVPDALIGDPTRLAQILHNLTDNAVKFTSRGEIVIRATALQNEARSASEAVAFAPLTPNPTPPSPGERGDKARRASEAVSLLQSSICNLQFQVCDTGIGLPADDAGRIFDPFEQGDDTAARQYGGVGLGLTVAAQLVSLMGGKIEAESQTTPGSTFRFQIPLETHEMADTPTPHPILVVLSCADQRLEVEDRLTGWGMSVVSVGTGREALTELLRVVVEGKTFGLVVIEEHLPDLSAREVLQRVRDRSDNPPPMLLFGHTENDLPLPDGVSAVLPRDSAHPHFRVLIERALARQAALV